MCLDGSCRCLSTHGMRGEVVILVLGGGVGGMNTPAGVIPLPRVAMNGKIAASSPVAVVPNGEPGEDLRLSISVVCYLILPTFWLKHHISPLMCSRDLQSCVLCFCQIF